MDAPGIETPAVVPDQPKMAGRGLETARRFREYGIIGSFAALFIVLSLVSSSFLTEANLTNLLEQNAPVGIIAITLTVVVLAGGLDFSSGAVFGLAGVVATTALGDLGVWPSLAAGVAAGMVVGIANGLLVAYLDIDSFICTLATGIIVAGLSLVITSGSLITATDPGFTDLGRGELFGLAYSAWIFLGGALILSLLLSRTVVGRWVYAVGDNPEAARLSGLPTRAIRAGTFAVAGAGAGLAGILVTSQTTQAQPQSGLELVVTAFAAVVVGGTSVNGGRGAIWRTVMGILFLAIIANGLNLLSIEPIYQQIIQGTIILAAITVDRLSRSN